MPRARPHSALLLALPFVFAACGGSSMPDPKDAVRAYAEAAARGDADAIYGMLSEKGQRSLSRDEVRRLVGQERKELADQAKALASPGVVVKARARVRYPDGEDATLELEGGTFRISAADALPAGARTPAQALEQLRRVLARRSYAGLLRVLSPSTRSAIENDLRSLVEGLEHPEGLEVEVAGDRATVQIPGGHEVKLRREAGVWHVEDFD
ncbi:hypothetical protein [Polyangium aurulentum]|uniref:hypothetical protein n=1 Tax=Polyangium aurulentum TaxID=2567896 RepID=UPI001F2D1031|nr:hypothetical protein [Polyangium aurulentum]